MKARIKAASALAGSAVLLTLLPFNALASDTAVKEGNFSYSVSADGAATVDKYFYSDSYFTEPSATDNAHRTSMSMALALSTMESRNSNYVTALFEDIGFTDVTAADMADAPTRDTIGTAIAHKNVDGTEIIAVAVRGAKYDREWAANFTPGAEVDIKGFETPAQLVLQRIRDYRVAHDISNAKIWITGYSRGGAVADLAGAYIDLHPDEFGTTADDVFVYTFESPAGSADPAQYDNIRNIRNKNDVINYVYPESWGIHSCGKDQWIGEDKEITTKTLSVGLSIGFADAGTAPKDEFVKGFIQAVSAELTREKYAGDFETAAADVVDMYMSKSPEDRSAITSYLKGILMGNVASDPQLLNIYQNDIFNGILLHNSDKMYQKLTDDLKAYIAARYASDSQGGTSMPLTFGDMMTLSNSMYPLLRTMGPVMVKDYYYGNEGSIPANYDDPDYDPAADPAFTGETVPADQTEFQIQVLAADNTAWYEAINGAQPMPMYNFATFFGGFGDIAAEHMPDYNWELVKQLDTYYTEGLPESSSDTDSSSEASSSAASSSEASSSEASSDIVSSSETSSYVYSSAADSSSAASSAAASSAAANSSTAPPLSRADVSSFSSATSSTAANTDKNPATGVYGTAAVFLIAGALLTVSRKQK